MIGQIQKQQGYLFLTGGTGFLGRTLLEEIIVNKSFAGVYLLVKSSTPQGISAFQRVRNTIGDIALRHKLTITSDENSIIVHYSDQTQIPIIVVIGDLIQEDLTITEQYDFELVTHVCHAAAITNFAAPEDQLQRVNVGGTLTMLEFARQQFTNLLIFGYVGTAFDLYTGEETHISTVYPSPPDKFVNGYTRSKWMARKAVVESNLPYCVFLPGIVTGQSSDGYIPEDVPLGVIYQPLQGLSILKNICQPFLEKDAPLKIDFRALGDDEATLNILPVDTTAKLLNRILASEHNKPGSTYYLTNPQSIPVGDILDEAGKIVAVEGVRLDRDLHNPTRLERLFMKMLAAYAPFMLGKVGIYDTTSTMEIAGDVPIPSPDRALLNRLLTYVHDQYNWGHNQSSSLFKDSYVQQISKRYEDDIRMIMR
jgi:nucleoside-diphosphate-sugar epimerase